MAIEKKTMEKKKQSACKSNIKNCGAECGAGGAFYGLGFLGMAAYYILTATSFWEGFIGFLKAIVWPAFLVYELLAFIGA